MRVLGSQPSTFNAASDFRNCSGAFDPVAQITYRQTFNTPYLGLRGTYTSERWRLNVDLVGTPFVWSSDKDLHVGATVFKDTFRQQNMLGATAQASYQITPMLALFMEADGQWYFNRKGVAESKDVTTGEYSNFGPNTAGISLRTARVSAGVKATY